jgi:hypothetical protein
MRSFGELWFAAQRPLSRRAHLVVLGLCLVLIGFTVHRLVNGRSELALTLVMELVFLSLQLLSYRNTRRRDERRP